MKTKNIHSTLLWNYILFVLMISTVSTITLMYMYLEMDSKMTAGLAPISRAQDIVRPDYQHISIKGIHKSGGWVEVLNERKQIIHVIGTKKDRKQRYTERELYQALDNPLDQDFYYSLAPFQTDKGQSYLCLVKVPRKAVTIEVQVFQDYEQTIEEVTSALFRAIPLFLIPFVLMIYLYSRWTAQKISRPLKSITEGLKKMTAGQYETRLTLKAESEFAQIRDAFNYLADKLETTKREKQRLQESKQRILVDISHDLKTPITSIQGYAKALHEGIVTEEEKRERYLKLIYDKSLGVTSLVDNLFELLKMDDTAYSLTLETYDLSECLREVVLSYFEELEEKEFDLQVQIPQSEVIYTFDQTEMRRVFANILSNALKYNSHGTRLRVELLELSDEIVIELADNGKGIPENVRGTIFDPFVRGDEARQSDGGTGLGLSIAKKIVEKHRGTLHLEENGVEKTVFVIRLPKT